MATLVTEQGIVHYEASGRGRPVLLLHGWLNSWEVWRPTVQLLSKDFRLYALDFLGFGDSGDQAEDFSINNFVTMVREFMDRMGIVRAPLVGHSMGGTVALSTALQYPDQVVKVVVVGSPINGNSLSPLLRLAANPNWISVGQTTPMLYNVFQLGFRPFLRLYSHFLARDGTALGKMLTEDTSKLALAPFFQSISTLRQTDLRPRLGELKMPVMGIYGKKDLIVNPKQYQTLQQYLPSSQVALYNGSGHFPMLDESERFHTTLRDFLNNG